jgi:hypothetical protein
MVAADHGFDPYSGSVGAGNRSQLVASFADYGRGVTLAPVVGATALDLASGLPHEVVVILRKQVLASAPVADVLDHLMPRAVRVLALRQGEDLPHRRPPGFPAILHPGGDPRNKGCLKGQRAPSIVAWWEGAPVAESLA